MISLKKSLREYEELSGRIETAVRCYVSAINGMEQHAIEVSETDAAEHRRSLREIRKQIGGEPGNEILEKSSLALETELRRYAQRSTVLLRERQKEIREILEILAQAAQTVTNRSDRYSTEFGKLARDLETVAELDDLSLVRRRLSEDVGRLKSVAETLQKEEFASVVEMQSELQAFRRRLQEAETMAATDALTGLSNRREAERLMSRKIRSGRSFCVMLFDLDGFKAVNDRYGHIAGDHLLKAFAKRLQSQFRSDDTVCRWGGDEFLAVLNTTLPDVRERAKIVAGRMGGLYAVQTPRGAVNIYVSASVGAAQYEPGETEEQLFTRADACLYENKQEHGSTLMALGAQLEAETPKA